jgi:NAD(P)-dependent dehydrogenase (short-subunit alcohol dehydrogenase family)
MGPMVAALGFHVIEDGAPHVPDAGSIVITSSVTGLIGPHGVAACTVAKHGPVGLVRTATKGLAARRIRVTRCIRARRRRRSRTTSRCERPAGVARTPHRTRSRSMAE